MIRLKVSNVFQSLVYFCFNLSILILSFSNFFLKKYIIFVGFIYVSPFIFPFPTRPTYDLGLLIFSTKRRRFLAILILDGRDSHSWLISVNSEHDVTREKGQKIKKRKKSNCNRYAFFLFFLSFIPFSFFSLQVFKFQNFLSLTFTIFPNG